MYIRSLIVVLAASAIGAVSLTACEIKECDASDPNCTSGVGGNGGESGEGGAGGGEGGAGGGTGGAGGGMQTLCSCGVFITTPEECDGLLAESEDLYDDYAECICSDKACGMGSTGAECADTSCADPPKLPSTTCGTCVDGAGMAGGACNAEFMACSGDI